MTDIGELVVRIKADAAQLESELKKANTIIKQSAGGWSDAFSAAGKAVKGMGIEVGGLNSALAPLVGAVGTGRLLQYSDAWKGVENRLRLVTGSSQELAGVSQRLFDIAQDTRSSLESTVVLYQRLTFSTKGLGVEQSEVLKFTEQLNKQLLVGGLSSTEAATSVFQLTQAFNKGKLDGDEFRTILESAPPILEALQSSLKKTKGEILAMSAAGKLGPRELIDAINGMSDVTDERFSKLSITISQAFTLVDNAFTKFIGSSDDVNSASAAIAGGLKAVAENMDVAGRAALAVAAVVTTRLAIGIGASLAALNPYAAAVTAVVGGLTLLATASSDAQKQQESLNKHLQSASEVTAALEKSNRELSESKGRGITQLRDENALLKTNAEERLNGLKVLVAEHEARLAFLNKANVGNSKQLARSGNNSYVGLLSLEKSASLDEESTRELKNIASAYEQIRELESAIGGGKGKPATGTPGAPATADKAAQKKMQDARQALEDYNLSLREQGVLLGLSERDQAAEEARFRTVEIARRGGIVATREQIDANVAAALANYDLKESQDDVNRSMQEAVRFQQELHDKLSSSLTDIAFKAGSASEAMLAFAESIARAALEKRVAGPLADSLIGTGGSPGVLDGAIDKFGKILGFADGGTPPIGVPSIVGERGPEIFVPKQAGTIIPNGAMGGHTVIVQQTINLSPGLSETVNAAVLNAAPHIAAAAKASMFAELQKGGAGSSIVGLRS